MTSRVHTRSSDSWSCDPTVPARKGPSSTMTSPVAMPSPLALHESTPVRRALRLLASAHLREAAVVDDGGHPLGVFRDVDGLRYLTRARAIAL